MTKIFKWIWNAVLALNLYAAFTDNSTFRRILLLVAAKLRLIALYLAEKLR